MGGSVSAGEDAGARRPGIAARRSFAYLTAGRPEDATQVLDHARRRGNQERRMGDSARTCSFVAPRPCISNDFECP
jgi:hypothetical protein